MRSASLVPAAFAAACLFAVPSIRAGAPAARPDVKAAWGIACLVEAHGPTVPFDTGSDPAAQTAPATP